MGQSPQVNLLLHGPPGTGKSSFAYRVAMTLGRHIVSLDLRDIRNKVTMYQILNKPRVNELTRKPSECVFVFEEFDIGIKLLFKEWQIRQQRIKRWEHDINNFDIESYLDKSIQGATVEQNNANVIIPPPIIYGDGNNDNGNKNNGNNNNGNNNNGSNNNNNNGSNNNGNQMVLNLLSAMTKQNNDTNQSPYNHHIPDLDLTEDKSKFSVNDLLEIFQGTVPNDGAIMIATTNNYDEIKEMCPALFRPGRLTPVHFGYVKKETMQEISRFYFGRDLEIYIPDNINIPTSQIIQLAMESRTFDDLGTIDDKFDYFSQMLDEMLE